MDAPRTPRTLQVQITPDYWEKYTNHQLLIYNPLMSLLLNVLWFIFGGFLVSLAYILGGILLCITIIGIPFGIQCFKLSILGMAPFGHEIRETEPPGGAVSVIMNVIWIILPGLELALMHLFLAAFFALTIIGLPFAVQHLKMTRLAILPFGFRVVESR
jgi:uncharacterized membrane protein YccF (DUF307 family)